MSDKNQWLKNLSQTNDLWATELESVPAMIKCLYDQLKRLADEGQVYGVILQLKDLYEALYKVPIVMVLIILESDLKYKEGEPYANIIRASLEEPLSMGKWDSLAYVIIENNDQLKLPVGLIKILQQTRELYRTEITDNWSDVVNWRNNEVGHGALRFEDDEDYQEEIEKLLQMLKSYFDGADDYSIKGLYDNTYLIQNGSKIVGDAVPSLETETGLILYADKEEFGTNNYINRQDICFYLFDSFYSRKREVKYYSYFDGRNKTMQSKYFDELYFKFVLRSGKDFNVNSKYINSEEEYYFEKLNEPFDYIKPTDLQERLRVIFRELDKGVVAVFMERGTGKSAFANKMSGLYNSSSLIKRSASRSYHVQNASLRGINDFVNSVNYGFRHSFNSNKNVYKGLEELQISTLNKEDPSVDMADFLNSCHEYYRKKENVDYTILIIDGIDEITDQTKKILDFIPSRDLLHKGVFIIMLSRFADEKTVIGSSRKFIKYTESISQRQIRIRRKDDPNIKMLRECLDKQKKKGNIPLEIDSKELIKKADYRFLYLKAYLV